MSETGILVFMLLVFPLCFAIGGVMVYFYSKRMTALVAKLEAEAPVLWQALGCPRQKWLEHQLTQISTIEPLWPLLKWLLAGDFSQLQPGLAADARGVRQLFFAITVAFVAFFAIFIWFAHQAG